MSIETINSLLATNKLLVASSVQRTNLLLQPTNAAFSGLSAPSALSTPELYDLGGVLLTLPSGNILDIYGGAYSQNYGTICMQQSANGGGSWTPYAGSVQGGGTAAPSGTVNTAGTAVTWETGNKFFGTAANPATITINSVSYGIASINSSTSITLSTSAGTQTGVPFVFPLVAGPFYTALPTLESWNNTGLVTPANSIVIFWQTNTNGSTNFLGYSSRSTDNGVTWSAASAMPAGYGVPTNGNCVVIPGSGVCPDYPSGVLFVPVINSALNSIVLMQSTDDGVTWTVGPTIGNLGATEECSVAWAGGNTLVGFCRNNTGTVAGTTPMKFLYSTNMGTSWTITNSNIDLTQTLPVGSSGLSNYTMISPFLINSSAAQNQMTLLFCERSSWNGISPSAYTRFRAITFDPLVAMASPTGFSTGQLLDSATSIDLVDAGYPSAANTSGNTYLLQWGKNKTVGCTSCQAQFQFTATYNPPLLPLTVQSISPASGVIAGGTAVTILGEGFKSGATVRFGGASATSIVVVSPGVITCVTPAGSVGFVNVVVGNSGGATSTTANGFFYSNVQLVASAATSANPSSNTATLNSTGATLLVVLVNGFSGFPTVSDSLGNTWNYGSTSGETGGTTNVRFAYAFSNGGGALVTGSGHVVTVAAGNYAGGSVYAFSGTNTTAAVLVSSVGAGNQNLSSPISSLTATSPAAGNIIITGFGVNQTANSPTVSGNGDGNNWSTPVGNGNVASVQAWWASYAIALSATNSNPKWTCSGVTQANQVLAVFAHA